MYDIAICQKDNSVINLKQVQVLYKTMLIVTNSSSPVYNNNVVLIRLHLPVS